MMMVEDFKKGINNSLKEIQNTGKQPISLNECTQKYINDFQKKTSKQGKELNKTNHDLKLDIDIIRKKS